MGTKKEEIALALAGAGCLGKAADDEPVFILRAKDAYAPALVQLWADCVAAVRGDMPKTVEARNLAARMRSWQAKNGTKVPD